MPIRTHPHAVTPALAAAVVALAAALVACVPGADGAFGPPSFRLHGEGSGFVRLDVVGTPSPTATFRMVLDVANPNPVAVRLSVLEGELSIASVPSASVHVREGVDLPARGQARITADVTVPADALTRLGGALADVLAGRSVAYRLDAEVGIDVVGTVQRFPRTTIVAGEVRSHLGLVAPTVRYDAAASGVRSVAFDRVVIELAFDVTNESAVGMVARAPDVRVSLGGRDVATVAVGATPLPAGGSVRVVQELIVNPSQLGAAIVSELSRLAAGQGASLRIALAGWWDLEVPGIATRRTENERLLDVLLE